MYPDEIDVQNVIKHYGIQADASAIWADVARIRVFLSFARDVCFNHGKHFYVATAEIKELTEKWLGHAVSPDAFIVGGRLADVFHGKQTTQLKFPLLNRLGEFRQEWAEELANVEREITEEKGLFGAKLLGLIGEGK